MAIDVVTGACDPGEESDVQGVAGALVLTFASLIAFASVVSVAVIARKVVESERAALS